jgi:hypothetical protein
MIASATIGCCPECAELVALWVASEHPLRNRWMALIRRWCRLNCN